MAPRLSVIVPVYDVEAYLPACLDSLRAQTFHDLEVIMVDDGSPDDSARICAEYAAEDSRFKLVRKENAGLGAARNTGAEHLHPASEFLTFVDSDDTVPPDAYRLMVASLEESGSDFVSGNVLHINSTRVWQSPMHRFLRDGSAKRTHVSENRRLLGDRTAWNKVFRRRFWEKHALAFPEGVLYEDTPVMVPAHFLAEAVDVIGEPTYHWRLRDGEGAPSITQRRTEVRGLRDRIAAVESVSKFLAARPEPEAKDLKLAYDRSVLTSDLRLFLTVLPDGDEEFRAEFIRGVNRFLNGVDPEIVLGMQSQPRLKWLLVRKHALTELVALLEAERQGDRGEVEGLLRKYASFPSVKGIGDLLPKKALRLDQDLKLWTSLREVSWRGGRLRLAGHAAIQRVSQPGKHSSVKVLAIQKVGSRRPLLIPMPNVHAPEATAASKTTDVNYDWSGWEADIDPRRLRKGDTWEEGVWRVGMAMTSGGLLRKRAISAKGPDSPGAPPYQWLDRDYRLLPFAEKGALRLRVERVRALVTGYREVDGSIAISGVIRVPVGAGEQVALRVTNRGTGEVLDYPVTVRPQPAADTYFEVFVPLADVALLPEYPRAEEPDATALAARRNWSTTLLVTAPDGTSRNLSTVVGAGLADAQFALSRGLAPGAEDYEVACQAGNNGYLKFSGRPLQARVTKVEWTGDRFVLHGSAPVPLDDAAFFVSARSRADEKRSELRLLPDGTFVASFAPGRMSGPNKNLPLPTGRWNFLLRIPGRALDIPFVIDRLAVERFPVVGTVDGNTFEFQARWYNFPQLYCLSDLDVGQQGPYHQARLRKDVYEAGRSLPLRESVVFISFNGRQFSDSPRAVHEELVRRGSDLEQLWVVRDNQVELPDTVRPLRMWSKDWYEALARSRYIVTNAHLPHWIERRPGQVVVQTWHGTMLKKIGLDIEAPAFNPDYHEQLRAETKNWSLLVSANRFSTPILRRAMGFEGEILETGYPRNDHLHAPDKEKRAAEVRRALGLPEGRKVVLYAPTWRDNQAHRRGQFRLDLQLDLEDAERRLGRDHVVLVRRHSNVVDAVSGAGNGFVFDVSDYPDIADLYLVADILVTDYSSVMFDYANLQRPMLFFTYDLEHYRDVLRGFYFDFEREAPGPLIPDSDGLISAIRDIDTVRATYADRYRDFHERFCGLDDGQATGRVVDRLLRRGEELRHES
ncbi:bifunctional glycosyltransferase/CDP-glycerol:glycerophosphate glycerophosphotransferase [Streptomyces evansiae]|uniref:bifunctional glycosyltransferase/CDP-glycerol:glycerophosphate glycerophosphotransferase n=1 Tax=Streptomyces evansiae TaxID=3075535 RepID=UPI002884CDB9|nr:bifunctional glycosyltransferase family 2 protein/CDP-glycerol:glycerophosphate glycerophosphotransferase [Streptomyces sp. DSM 41859]MDT0423210.1 bifunctional glycosyltransferase family 2 protein/CDP-glycerol:glycerophosphate glycerophosphotransferase [Streptomyces sp. DSM 41859]